MFAFPCANYKPCIFLAAVVSAVLKELGIRNKQNESEMSLIPQRVIKGARDEVRKETSDSFKKHKLGPDGDNVTNRGTNLFLALCVQQAALQDCCSVPH